MFSVKTSRRKSSGSGLKLSCNSHPELLRRYVKMLCPRLTTCIAAEKIPKTTASFTGITKIGFGLLSLRKVLISYVHQRRLKYFPDQRTVSSSAWSRNPANPKMPFRFSSSSCCAMQSLSKNTVIGDRKNTERIRCQKKSTKGKTEYANSVGQKPSGINFAARSMPTQRLTSSEERKAALEL